MRRIINRIIPFKIKYFLSIILYKYFKLRIKGKEPHVKGFEETVNYIINNGVSVSRFGDGEFQWIFQNRSERNFEKNSPILSEELLKSLKVNDKRLMICIPDIFNGLDQYNIEAREYWGLFLGLYGRSWISILNKNKQYYDTQFTRPYMDYNNKENAKKKFELLKKIWEKRDILIVEGEKSRFGVADDLLDNAGKINRILAPSENAFEKYDEIYQSILDYVNLKDNVLVLVSLGPTATILAANLIKYGVQTIDIGHLDIEYNWYLMGSTTKQAVEGKYVNEVVTKGYKVNEITDDLSKKNYELQIIERIEGKDECN
ncbi:GT-D fold domain-containing glycosyltransferase [Companilactobacillus nuruki]|nr:GT-D fold domain-containing glycosyltransferase [Companilactobacillus nuruki]